MSEQEEPQAKARRRRALAVKARGLMRFFSNGDRRQFQEQADQIDEEAIEAHATRDQTRS